MRQSLAIILTSALLAVAFAEGVPLAADNGATTADNALLESWDSGLSSRCTSAAVVATNTGISMYGYTLQGCQYIQTYMKNECFSYNWSCMMTAKEDGVRSFWYRSSFGLELVHGNYRLTLWAGTR